MSGIVFAWETSMRLRNILFTGLVCLLGIRLVTRFHGNHLTVYFFDVGQGDSALLQFPGGSTMLVDAGGGFGDWDCGSRVLLPELTQLGILSLDVALLTHPDQDHIYGFFGLLESLNIGTFWFHQAFEAHPRVSHLRKRLCERGVGSVAWKEPVQKFWHGTRLTLVPPPFEAHKTSNNRSLVLYLDYGNCRLLFTGDIESETEAKIPLWPSDVLKVAHHGSRGASSDDFLYHVKPQLALISSGAQNRYGHPHTEALDRLRSAQAQIFRTDFHGYLKLVVTAEGKIRCESFHGECGEWTCSKKDH